MSEFALAFLGQLSRSRALAITDGGAAVYDADAGPVDWRDMPNGRPERVLSLLLDALARKVSLDPERLAANSTSCAFSISGVDKRLDWSRIQKWVSEAGFANPRLYVTNLAGAGHLGAFLGGPGLLIRCGHGSAVYAADSSGKSVVKGGWGGIVSDHGSAAWLGRQALIAVHRVEDRLAVPSEIAFVNELARDQNLPAVELIKQLNGKDELVHVRRFLSDIGHATCELARLGDPYADRLLGRAHSHLVALSKAATLELEAGVALPVCLRGGMVERREYFSRGLLLRLLAEVKTTCIADQRANGTYGPLVGVGLLALGLTHWADVRRYGSRFLESCALFGWAKPYLRQLPGLDPYVFAAHQ
ncbi:MAG: hypothetical protein SFV51_17330 [Bryobacteraceae bacterium]|nr:hypothetical protein [Bryobacteraceae bacterium]